ncbi:MAG: TetR/AcrR family transcriptional regulator [Epsilonproteobacteria bacterium]|nr:TetR/AcrR family transcriptional regulator [Campylobacterota bacterium]
MSKVSSREKLLDTTFLEVYMYGYAGASTANILKIAGVPKGSMYHHFPSKKALVIAMIEERLIPKVRESFYIEITEKSRPLDILNYLFKKISKNEKLIKYGCPLHKLMFEMGSLDSEISTLCHTEFVYLTQNLTQILTLGQSRQEIIAIDPKSLAEYIIVSTWGALSRTPEHSSKVKFIEDTQHILNYITK